MGGLTQSEQIKRVVYVSLSSLKQVCKFACMYLSRKSSKYFVKGKVFNRDNLRVGLIKRKISIYGNFKMVKPV